VWRWDQQEPFGNNVPDGLGACDLCSTKARQIVLFGAKNIFAIECELTESSGGFQFCNLQFWVDGTSYGDSTQQTTLGACLHNASIFLKYSDERYEPDLADEPAEVVFDALYESLRSDGHALHDHALERGFSRRFHFEEIGGESFREDFAAIVIESGNGSERFMWRKRKPGGLLQEAVFPPRYIDNVVKDFVAWGEGVAKSSVSVH
jgi:Immunity protein 42